MKLKNLQGLIVFVKNKEEGQVKTRIAKTMGNKAALAIYNQLLEVLKNNLTNLSVPVYIFYSNRIDVLDIWPCHSIRKKLQSGLDLGERIVNSIERVLQKHTFVLLIGSDCPLVDEPLITVAFEKLEKHDIVIGPSIDGGYYLIGVKKNLPKLFTNIPWSTDKVFSKTIEIAKQENLSVFVLQKLLDVDEEKDYIEYVEKGVLKLLS